MFMLLTLISLLRPHKDGGNKHIPILYLRKSFTAHFVHELAADVEPKPAAAYPCRVGAPHEAFEDARKLLFA